MSEQSVSVEIQWYVKGRQGQPDHLTAEFSVDADVWRCLTGSSKASLLEMLEYKVGLKGGRKGE